MKSQTSQRAICKLRNWTLPSQAKFSIRLKSLSIRRVVALLRSSNSRKMTIICPSRALSAFIKTLSSPNHRFSAMEALQIIPQIFRKTRVPSVKPMYKAKGNYSSLPRRRTASVRTWRPASKGFRLTERKNRRIWGSKIKARSNMKTTFLRIWWSRTLIWMTLMKN